MKTVKYINHLALAGWLAAAGPGGAAAERGPAPAAPLRLTLTAAQQQARAAAPRLMVLSAQRDGAAAAAARAQAERKPDVTLSAGYSRLSSIDELRLPLPGGPRTLFPDLPNQVRSRVEGSEVLLSGGRVTAQIEAANALASALGHDTRAAERDLDLEVAGAFWALVTAQERARVVGEALKMYEADLIDVRNRNRFGLAARNEILALEVERDRAELKKIEAEGGVALAEADLARLLGGGPGTTIVPEAALDAAAGDLPALDDLLARARSARPERGALAQRVEAAEQQARSERARRRPQLVALAGFDYGNPNRRLMPQTDNWRGSWDLSLNLALDLCDGGRSRLAETQRRTEAAALRAQLAEFDSRLQLEVTARRIELRTARAAIPVSDRKLESARENRRVVSDRYREGLVPASELIDAEVSLLSAGLERTQALATVQLAEARLIRAVGD